MNKYNTFGTLDFYSVRINTGGTYINGMPDTVYLYKPYENKVIKTIASSLNDNVINAVKRIENKGFCSPKKRILGYSLKEAYAILYTELTK
jgi:hypothetical protein